MPCYGSSSRKSVAAKASAKKTKEWIDKLPALQEERRGTTFVELMKKEGCGLGLVVSGGLDKDSKSRVSYLRPGGIAQRSDALEVGDYIMSVNGIKTAMLRHDDIVNLLKNAGESVVLEVEYELPDPPQGTFSVMCKRIDVRLERETDTHGFTLRGGVSPDPSRSRALTITQLRPGSSADREGTLKVGDRILAINGLNVTQCTLEEALTILRHTEEAVDLLIEYDVSVIEAVQNASGPLLVEIDKTPGCTLGVTLTSTEHQGAPVHCIDTIKPASIADRCGALHLGDHILAVDDTSLEHMTVAEADQLLKCSMGEQIRLEIIPCSQFKDRDNESPPSNPTALPPLTNSRSHSASLDSLASLQSHGTYNSMTTHVGSAIAPAYGTLGSRTGTLRSWANRNHQTSSASIPPSDSGQPQFQFEHDPDLQFDNYAHAENVSLGSLASAGTYASVIVPRNQVCHTENTEMVLIADHRGFGITLENSDYKADILTDPPIICHLEQRSSAERCGVIQEGDRLLSINGQSLEHRTLGEANKMMADSGVKVILQTEYDVAESIVPSSGIFVVKLAKRGSGLGITINSPSNRKTGEPLLISDVKKGSVSHRTGTIQPGDKLLAVDNVRMDSCSLEDAAQVLQSSADIVKLKIQKDECFADEPDPSTSITYTVELPKYSGPLGITISGTEENFDPIFISSLAEGGLAEKTGALHVGDRILAINGQSLRGRPLSYAIQLLQNATSTVTLKITRPANKNSSRNGVAGKSHDSVDSALESWDSSGLDSNNAKSIHREKSLSSHREGSGSTSSQSTTTTEATKPHARPHIGGSTYCDLEDRLHLEEEERWDAHSPLLSGPPSCTSSTDEWSKQMDQLDHLDHGTEVIHDLDDEDDVDRDGLLSSHDPAVAAGLKKHSSRESSSGHLPNPANQRLDDLIHSSGVAGAAAAPNGGVGMSQQQQQQGFSSNHISSSVPDLLDDKYSAATGGGTMTSTSSLKVVTAEMHLREVEEQLQNIFTPTPVELFRITVERQRDNESFGFSLSDGVYEKGVYISAIQPGGPADRGGQLKPFDRLLQVNGVRTKEFDCHQVVPMIARSGHSIHLVISRNPLATGSLKSTPRSNRSRETSDHRSFSSDQRSPSLSQRSFSSDQPKYYGSLQRPVQSDPQRTTSASEERSYHSDDQRSLGSNQFRTFKPDPLPANSGQSISSGGSSASGAWNYDKSVHALEQQASTMVPNHRSPKANHRAVSFDSDTRSSDSRERSQERILQQSGQVNHLPVSSEDEVERKSDTGSVIWRPNPLLDHDSAPDTPV